MLCAVTLMISAVSFAQLPETNTVVSVADKISMFTEEFDLSVDQLALVKEYVSLDKLLGAKGLSVAAIATQKSAFLKKITDSLPKEVVAELTAFDAPKPALTAKKKGL